MYGVAFNHTRGYARQPARWYRNIDRAPIEEHTENSSLITLSGFSEDADLADRLLRGIAHANPVGAEALLHKFWGDRSQTEIAELLGVSNATISRAIAKAYDQAAQLLAEWNTQ